MPYIHSYRKERLKMTFAEKLGEFCGRLLVVLVRKGILDDRDALFINGDMNEAEWIGDEDE